jgi:hypothetical protein
MLTHVPEQTMTDLNSDKFSQIAVSNFQQISINIEWRHGIERYGIYIHPSYLNTLPTLAHCTRWMVTTAIILTVICGSSSTDFDWTHDRCSDWQVCDLRSISIYRSWVDTVAKPSHWPGQPWIGSIYLWAHDSSRWIYWTLLWLPWLAIAHR